LGTFLKEEFLFRSRCVLLLKKGRATISLGMKIEASLGMIFKASFDEFSVKGWSYKREGTTSYCGHGN
jgi:hypothetical protein